ncbi:MAG: DeoR family transcriptional regulator, partial [Spirosoma sp.]|nr:DeoR family transcriptional regulator [Spirosoma sp.]
MQTVEDRGSADVQELADLVQTSAMTIRRDLVQLAASGLLYRTRGGAMKISMATDTHRFANKTAVNPERKDYICQLAAREIQEGDIIFMDCGSTVLRLCPFIRHKRITVVTNSLPIVAELMESEVLINLVGGEVDKERQAIHGLIAEEHMARYRANRAFIGVDAMSLQSGLSAHSEREASTAIA